MTAPGILRAARADLVDAERALMIHGKVCYQCSKVNELSVRCPEGAALARMLELCERQLGLLKGTDSELIQDTLS